MVSSVLWAIGVLAASLLGGPRVSSSLHVRSRAQQLRIHEENVAPRLQRLRHRFRRARFSGPVIALPKADAKIDGNGTVDLLVLSSPGREDWIAVGCNETAFARWLRYELSEAALAELIVAATAAHAADDMGEGIEGAMDADAAISQLLRRETLKLGFRSTHSRLRHAWRGARLLLRGVRLSDLVYNGREHAEALADTQPVRSQKLIERAFRRELFAHTRRTRRLQPSEADTRLLLDYVRTHAGIDPERLRAPSAAPTPHPLQDLDDWRELLTWFRERFPYNRGASADSELLGNVLATPDEAAFRAGRTELQWCGASDEVTRFPRFNAVAKILQTRQGRCGEYAQVLYQLVRALGWRARLVFDWTDHLWVEALLPVGAPPTSGERPVSGDETAASADGRCSGAAQPPFRWVMMDPCEAAVDMPGLYADWGKNHTYIIAIGDGRIVDVAATYARDLDATIQRRDLSPAAVRRSLAWARFASRLPA